MAMSEYYLRIDRFTQNRFTGDPEVDVNPDRIDREKNLHVYLTGNIRPDRSVTLIAFKSPSPSAKPAAEPENPATYLVDAESVAAQSYKASLPHYSLPDRSTVYLLKAFDDSGQPWAVTSHEIKTTEAVLTVDEFPRDSEATAFAAVTAEQTLSEAGVRFIAGFEGFSSRLYNDPGGHCTIGYGHLVHHGRCDGNEPEDFKQGISQERGLELLGQDADVAERAINQKVQVPLTQYQFDALVSFVFNVGAGAFGGSTLLRRLNQGEYKAVPAELMRWVNSGGRPLPGLVRRRKAEGVLFSQGSYSVADAPTDADISESALAIVDPPADSDISEVERNDKS